MASIADMDEPWRNHDGKEVEDFIKSKLTAALSAAQGKVGYVALEWPNLIFFDESGGTEISSISLIGDVYNIAVTGSLGQTFYVLADESEKLMTITPSTTVGQFGQSGTTPVPESYTYAVSINSGSGYVQRLSGDIGQGGSATFNIRPYLATGDNYIRVSVTGLTSGQTRSVIFVGTLTTLSMSCSHAWQNVWHEGQAYTLTGIRFAGSVVKTLHVSVDGVECTPVTYQANQSYSSSATTYSIPANKFPAVQQSGVHEIKVWMEAQGISTRKTAYNIICVKSGDTSPLIAINKVASPVVNYTSALLFSYTLHNADKAVFTLSAALGNSSYPAGTNIAVSEVLADQFNDFRYSVEVDTGDNSHTEGTFSIVGKAYSGTTPGKTATVTTVFDNTYSYIATPGALFYMNAAMRDNTENNHTSFVNEAGASGDGRFAASFTPGYSGSWGWDKDGWSTDPSGNKAFCVPAGLALSTKLFQPLKHLVSYSGGMTLELMIRCDYPADYDTPMITFWDSDSDEGVRIYPTKIVVMGANERQEVVQSVSINENRMTHICITFAKNYEGGGQNLCSIYVNGISNVCFAFQGGSTFGTDPRFTIGTSNGDILADTYLYKMRVYGSALEPSQVFNNFLNSIVDGVEFGRRETYDKNNIIDTAVDYTLCKRAGYNIMVVTLPDDTSELPMFGFGSNKYDGCKVRFEYAGDGTKDVEIDNVSIDGQGTTSKQYFRWNLRYKTGNLTTWRYGDGSTAMGKKGRMINDGSYVQVDRVTAKKNTASSMQGHKMGMTGLYNDLYKEVGLGSHLPDSDARVAVYQFPFVGFRYRETSGQYEFIGLYTAGPDKGSKVTFGYKSSYRSLLSLEGPNHTPRGTRFLDPWVDVEYDHEHETLTFGGDEGWDCDYVGNDLETDAGDDASAIQSLYESEWKPAYECVFNNSPYIVSAEEMAGALGVSSDVVSYLTNKNNATTILSGSTPVYSPRLHATQPVSNQLLCFYDSSYDIYFYRRSEGKFEKLSSIGVGLESNVRTPLSSYLNTSSPSTQQIIEARAARFRATASNYWDIDQTVYHYAFCLLFGASDNFAKNSYPFKFRGYSETQPSGESIYCKRWGWREDDLDTVMPTDNNGNNTKAYYVEHGDTLNGVEIYQGGNSALWVLIRDNYSAETGTMMSRIATAAAAIASRHSIQGEGLHGSLLNVVSYYCWEQSAKYFGALLYESDRRWTYIEPWLLDQDKSYNGVKPLTQAVGDQYQGERLWMERRIAYIFSKYHIGAFTGDTEGYSRAEFTLASPGFTFHLTPAIWLYPVVSSGSSNYPAGRTEAGAVATLYCPGDGQTTNYLKGVDWLSDIGDLSGMQLTSRGGESSINFAVSGKRLITLKVGDATAGNVRFNATSLSVSSPSLTSIDARNTATLSDVVDLRNCPRLRTALFGGSGATGLLLPEGSKVSRVVFPDASNLLFMHTLNVLQQTQQSLTLPNLSSIVSVYINQCKNINAFGLVMSILQTSGNHLANVTIIWAGVKDVSSNDISNIIALASLTGKVTYNNGSIGTESGKPHVEGTVRITGYFYQSQLDALRLTDTTVSSSYTEGLSELFGTNFRVRYNPDNLFVEFACEYMRAAAVALWDTNSDGGLTTSEVLAVTSIANDAFMGNTQIVSFDEFRYFAGCTTIANGTAGQSSVTKGSFANCTSLRSVSFPDSLTSIGTGAFYGCSSLLRINIPPSVTIIRSCAFRYCSSVTGDIAIGDGVTVEGFAFSLLSQTKKTITFGTGCVLKDRCLGESGYWRKIVLGSNCCYWFYSYSFPIVCDLLVFGSGYSQKNSSGSASLTFAEGQFRNFSGSWLFFDTTPMEFVQGGYKPTLYAIYVPLSAVDTYKQATTWSTYANIIYGFLTVSDESLLPSTNNDADYYYITSTNELYGWDNGTWNLIA